MCIYGWSYSADKQSQNIILEILKVMGIELIVGSSVVLFNYLIYGREIKNHDLSEESYCTIKEIVSDGNRILLSSISTNKELAPSYTYEACDKPNIEFNKQINSALKSALEYTYFGDSSTFFVSRLKSMQKNMANQAHKKINVFIPDYRIEELFTSHKLEIRKRYATDSVDSDQAIITARMRILQNMYVLKKISNKYSITVYLHKEIPFLRFETAKFPSNTLSNNDFLVLSFLPIDVNQKRFPPSFIYNNPTYYATFNGYIRELEVRSDIINEQNLTNYNFLEESRSIDPSLTNKSDQYILDTYFESYFNNLQKVDVK